METDCTQEVAAKFYRIPEMLVLSISKCSEYWQIQKPLQAIDMLKTALRESFEMEDLSEAKFILGLETIRDKTLGTLMRQDAGHP